MIDHLTLLYSVSTFGLIVVCMLLAAVRWFHMCKPFDEYAYYYYPARRVATFFMLSTIILMPYVWNPMDMEAWLLVKCYLITMTPLCSYMLFYRYFAFREYARRRKVVWGIAFPIFVFLAFLWVASLLPDFSFGDSMCSLLLMISSLTSLVFVVVTCIFIFKLYLIVHRNNFRDYSNVEDFPKEVAANTWFLPILYMIPIWAMVYFDSRIIAIFVMLWVSLLDSSFVIAMLHPRRKYLDHEICEAEETIKESAEHSLEDVDTSSDIPSTLMISDDTVEMIKHQIDAIVVDKKGFLDPHLTLTSVVEQCSFGRTYVSTVFNREYGGFFEYVNTYRLRYADEYRQNHPYATKKEILEASGFSSRSGYLKARNRLGWCEE